LYTFPSRDGGTGRRSGLKIRRPSGLGGSTPPPGTNLTFLVSDGILVRQEAARERYSPCIRHGIGAILTLPDMQRKKINLEKVLEALNTPCPSCGYSISPGEVVRVDFERQKCPKCGSVFAAKLSLYGKRIRIGVAR
jgi:ribosomal protein S27AE